MRISDWSSDVCSSDLRHANFFRHIIHSLDESSFAAVDAYGKNRCRVIPRNGDQSFEEVIDRHLFARPQEHGGFAAARAPQLPSRILDREKLVARQLDRKSTRLNSSH